MTNLPDHDPYRIHGLEQMLALFDDGNFLPQLMKARGELLETLRDHMDRHGARGCAGQLSIKLDFALTESGDVVLGASFDVKEPKRPKHMAAAYLDDDGSMTLFSPMMRRMSEPVRDVRSAEIIDPETGEVTEMPVRDVEEAVVVNDQ